MSRSEKNGSSRARSKVDAEKFAPDEQPPTMNPRLGEALKEEQFSAAYNRGILVCTTDPQNLLEVWTHPFEAFISIIDPYREGVLGCKPSLSSGRRMRSGVFPLTCTLY